MNLYMQIFYKKYAFLRSLCFFWKWKLFRFFYWSQKIDRQQCVSFRKSLKSGKSLQPKMPALFCDTVPRNVRKKTLLHFLPWMVFLHSLCSLLAAINFTNFVLYFYRLVWMKEMTGHNMAYLKIWIQNIFSYWLFLPGTWTSSTYYVVSSTVLICSRLFSNSVFCASGLEILAALRIPIRVQPSGIGQ